MEVTILMPCLNEEATVGSCVKQALSYLADKGIDGEVLVADNDSTDSSVTRAVSAGARVVQCRERGYGNALIYGISQSKGKYVIMGDCDCSYDFSSLDGFVDRLRAGADIVVGDRFAVPMEKGAMPFSHKLGVPFLSWFGRMRFQTQIHDFHCGLRGFDRQKIQELNLITTGMEFATEMIGKAARKGYVLEQVPVVLHRDMRNAPSHLRTISDGFRHLRFMIRFDV